MINWEKLSKEDAKKCIEIAIRFCKIVGDDDSLGIAIDISATHITNPLRLDDMLSADYFNLVHDVSGIGRHLNRDTGELMNGFLPRFSV